MFDGPHERLLRKFCLIGEERSPVNLARGKSNAVFMAEYFDILNGLALFASPFDLHKNSFASTEVLN